MSKFLPMLLVGISEALWGQSGEMWVTGGASLLSYGDIGSPFSNGSCADIRLDHAFQFGFRFGYNSAGHLGHEIQYGHNRSTLNDNTGVILPDVDSVGTVSHRGGYNLLYYRGTNNLRIQSTSISQPLAFVSAISCCQAQAIPKDSNVRCGVNYGSGIEFRISQLFGVRMDNPGLRCVEVLILRTQRPVPPLPCPNEEPMQTIHGELPLQ